MNTLTSADRHAVAFAQQAIAEYKQSDVGSNQLARQYKSETDLVVESRPITIDRPAVAYTMQNTGHGWWNESPIAQTLRAPCGGDSTKSNLVVTNAIHYIVRRLTPTECARLQGFEDRHGDIDEKVDFTDDEYNFWLNVRNTHAAINGKQVKEYTKAQMLTWYNKLHTDGAEYKMWGNGIALPPALYCMQGMAEILKNREE
jgi:DNA (cytosine-5)-methyltransferase 1